MGHLGVILLALAASIPGPARAADGTGFEVWDLPSPEVQLEMDPELVPVGKGAIFVPCMTDPNLEPFWLVYDRQGNRVAERQTGSRAIVPPGVYTVRIGSGAEVQMASVEVAVWEGKTALAPVEWAGLSVAVVSERDIGFRGQYEVIDLATEESYGIGIGADELQGERPRTWLLPPGVYKIVKAGESVHTRRNWSTVRLLSGELVRFRLVMDEETGEFLGAGIAGLEVSRTAIGDWKFNLSAGGDLMFANTSNRAGTHDGFSLNFALFLEGSIQLNLPSMYFYTELDLEQGWQKPADRAWDEFEKSLDRLRFNTIYIYRLLSWLGPYLRFGLETALFAGHERLDPPATVERQRADGSAIGTLTGVERLRISGPFKPMYLREGAGLNFDLLSLPWVTLNLRTGAGMKQVIADGVFTPAAPKPDGTYVYREVGRTNKIGAEASLLGSARLGRWVVVTTELDALYPFNPPGLPGYAWYDYFALDWYNTAGLRLTSFSSINYTFNLKYDYEVSSDIELEHRLSVRLQYDFL